MFTFEVREPEERRTGADAEENIPRLYVWSIYVR
jgi:hypothetical protein